jgi:periplasmic divalent cation tolerance protein
MIWGKRLTAIRTVGVSTANPYTEYWRQMRADSLSGKIMRHVCSIHHKKSNDSMTDALVVLCTCPDLKVAENLAGGLVGNGFAACVNILPQIRSIYRWQSELHSDSEVLMIIKTNQQAYVKLERWLLDNHPYDTPEVLALTVEAGAHNYLDWIDQATQRKK